MCGRGYAPPSLTRFHSWGYASFAGASWHMNREVSKLTIASSARDGIVAPPEGVLAIYLKIALSIFLRSRRSILSPSEGAMQKTTISQTKRGIDRSF